MNRICKLFCILLYFHINCQQAISLLRGRWDLFIFPFFYNSFFYSCIYYEVISKGWGDRLFTPMVYNSSVAKPNIIMMLQFNGFHFYHELMKSITNVHIEICRSVEQSANRYEMHLPERLLVPLGLVEKTEKRFIFFNPVYYRPHTISRGLQTDRVGQVFVLRSELHKGGDLQGLKGWWKLWRYGGKIKSRTEILKQKSLPSR